MNGILIITTEASIDEGGESDAFLCHFIFFCHGNCVQNLLETNGSLFKDQSLIVTKERKYDYATFYPLP